MQSMSEELKAGVLTAALPYIQKYSGKIVVVKYGGNAMINPRLKQAVMNDIVLLTQVGIRVVLVHGGGPEISATLKRLGIASQFLNGLRVTDMETMQVVQMVLAGKTNKDLVALIGVCGGRALGLCGIDGGMLLARQMKDAPELGYVGEVVKIDTRPILNALADGYIPVVATVGVDPSGAAYNINADTAAAEIAAALGAENLIALTDIRGLMRDVNDEGSLIPQVPLCQVEELIRQGVITGGMIPKVRSCESAVRAGVKKAVMIDGRVPHSILIEMLSDEGIGTMFVKEAAV
ncbi:MAG TPA: acetylglutamate kinase [Candidatus Excrementavichristensenella intestinipullorum]|nr:acetylglutamate kinase [Candidatus Excrementavichristensenella intestinipullorum]